MSREILLSQGKVTIVDDEDYERVIAMGKWTLHNRGYAYRWDGSQSPKKCILMHRFINNTPESMETDHINGLRLDNRKANLRSVTKKEFYRTIGRLGGLKSRGGGFAGDHELAVRAGRLGGKASRRGSKIDEVRAKKRS